MSLGAHRTAARFLLAALILAGTALQAASPLPAFRPEQTFLDGLWRLSFVAPEGRITVLLPDRLLPGRTVSGTVELEPRGQGQALVDNLAALRAYSLRVDGEEVSGASKSLRWRLPEGPSGRIELLDASGIKVSEVFASLIQSEGDRRLPARLEKAGLRRFSLPELTQRGRMIEIRGPFDGDFATTQVTLGGLAAEKVAESPEFLVVRNPVGRLGRLQAVISEDGAQETVPFNNFDIRITPPRKIARPGGQMALRVTVEGVQGLQESYPVVVYNRNPAVATFKGTTNGNAFQRMMEPGSVSSQGTFRFSVPVSVLKDGEAEVDGDVIIIVKHVPNVTWPPHTVNVTPAPYHANNVTWPPHVPNVTFPPYHAQNVTWPPHYLNVTWPPAHNANVTWPPHVANQSVWIFVVEDTPVGNGTTRP